MPTTKAIWRRLNRWGYGVSFPYSVAAVVAIRGPGDRRIPGIKWDKQARHWVVPIEEAARAAKRLYSYGIDNGPGATPVQQVAQEIVHCTGCTPPQVTALRTLAQRGVAYLAWDTGTGKSRVACEWIKAQSTRHKTLIVAPRMVLQNWRAELAKWGVIADIDEPYEATKRTKERIAGGLYTTQPAIVLCSYGSLHHLPESWAFSFLVYDEMHCAIDDGSKRTKALRAVSARNPGAIRLALSGTPFSTTTHDIHAQLDALCPGRFGTWYEWTEYYHRVDASGYEGARVVHEVAADKRAEWETRLSDVIHIVSRESVQTNMPVTEWSIIWKQGRSQRTPLSLRDWAQEQLFESPGRVIALRELLRDSPAPLGERTLIVCYLRETAHAIAACTTAVEVTGESTPKARLRKLADAPLVVATMRSINEGIDLRGFTDIIIAEAYPVPLYVAQVCGRFVRYGATAPVRFRFLGLRGTCDEVIMERLLDRLAEHDSLTSYGNLAGMAAAVEQRDLLDELRTSLAAMPVQTADNGWAGWNTTESES